LDFLRPDPRRGRSRNGDPFPERGIRDYRRIDSKERWRGGVEKRGKIGRS